MVVWMLVLVGIAMMLGGFIWGVSKYLKSHPDSFRDEDSYSRRKKENPATSSSSPSYWGPIALFSVGVVWFIWMLTGAAQIPATDIGVVENTVTGEFSGIGPGTHIFPFQPKLIPFVTHVTKYSLRRSNVEVGSPDDTKNFDIKKAVEADSNSPGRPSVYFWARVWAYPNQEMIVELHKRYGPDYLHNWIERVYIAALKSVQGKSEYYYVGQDRVGFQHEVEKALQEQLTDQGGTPIVFVQQLAVVNFKFSDATENFLQSVQKIEFDRQQAEQQIQVNAKQQEAQKISAQTSYLVETRNAERDRDAKIARATGDARAVELDADAQRHRIEQLYVAESEGILKVQKSLAESPEAYLHYQQTKQWDGKLPQYMLGNSPIPFIDLTPEK